MAMAGGLGMEIDLSQVPVTKETLSDEILLFPKLPDALF